MPSLKLLPLFLLLHLSLSLSSPLFLPLTKHPSTHHYLTRIYSGPPAQPQAQPTSLILDLNSPFVYLDCTSHTTNLITFTPLTCRSIQCTSATPNNCLPDPQQPPQQPCTLPIQNSTGAHSSGNLVEGTINFQFHSINTFLFLCVPHRSLSGLPLGFGGVLGLGKARTGAMSQISHSFDHPKKFTLCLSSKLGMISSNPKQNNEFFYKSMIYTPILQTSELSSYIIPLKSIKLQNKNIPFPFDLPPSSTVKLSTVDAYSKIVTPLYRELITAFVIEAEALHMPRYPPQGGFDLCYGVQGTSVVPVIDLVLQSEMVKWRIYGHNSMVKLDDEVMCLGVLDGGDDLGDGVAIVLGGHQLEDNLLEFDLGSSMLGFSSSLVKMDSSCNELSLASMNDGGGGGGGSGAI